MLKTHEIFAHMPPAQVAQLFTYLRENEKPLYQATMDTLAKQRKLRAIFLEKKPLPERHAWMQAIIGKSVNASVAAHLLQIWLVGAHVKMLCDFLDALGITHDENGTIEELPPAPPKAEIQKAVETLLEKHDRESVAIYLHAFQAMDDEGWSSLEEVLAEDERLKL